MSHDHTKFVLLSLARSGTTVFMSTLATHPEAYSHASPFAKQIRRGTTSYADEQFLAAHTEEDRFTNPKAFVDRLLAFNPGRKAVGFKMWRGQEKDACDYLMGSTDVKKVILERKNHLASFSSTALAQLSGQWHQKLDQESRPNKPKAKFDVDEFKSHLRKRVQAFDRYYENSKGDVLPVTYEGLIDVSLPKTAEFLGLSRFKFVEAQRKVNTSDILSRFVPENRDEILRTLDEIGHPEWVVE